MTPSSAMRLVLAAASAAAVLSATAPAAAVVRAPEFRAECLFSHRAMDDPIVRPGLPGASHSHDFFGNRSTNARSTAKTLRRGRTSCEPQADRSAYWVPTLYDRGRPVTAEIATFYYTSGVSDPRRIRPYPKGLKMLAGEPEATAPPDPFVAEWSCRGAAVKSSPSMVRCPRGSRLELNIRFPDCWNGRDLDSRDHRRHVAYSAGGSCPRGYPVAIPQLKFKVTYPVRGGGRLRLSSGEPYTAHGDFVNAWDPKELRQRVRRCLRRSIKCDVYGLPE